MSMSTPNPAAPTERLATWRQMSLWLGPVLALGVGLLTWQLTGLSPQACWTAVITTLCAVWWIGEPIPLAATSLVPFALFPLVGVIDFRTVATAYGHHLVLLMLGGTIVSHAMERTGAHRRIALGLVRTVGRDGGRRLVLGFLIAAAVCSMWMSNTATTVMLLPVVLAVIAASKGRSLTLPLLLAVPYGASIGGSGTPIATPPNLIFLEQYHGLTGTEISFTEWMGFGLPVVLGMIPLSWLWLCRKVRGQSPLSLPDLGPWRPAEVRVLLVFALMALLWMTRSGPFGGWGSLLGVEAYAGDSTVALLAVVVLFVLPSGEGRGKRLLDAEVFTPRAHDPERDNTPTPIPWGIFLLIGGGIAIGKAFGASNLSDDLGQALVFLAHWPTWLVIPLLCVVATFTTEVTSNTATANILMPILGAAAIAGGLDPQSLMLPAVFGLNYAFMLPVATAPNAIVYGTGRVTTGQMAREGFALNLIGVAVIAVVCWLLAA